MLAVLDGHSTNNIVLNCSDGEVTANADLIALASPVLEAAFKDLGIPKTDAMGPFKLDLKYDKAEDWLLMLKQLYPVADKVPINMDEVEGVLRLAHKYNIVSVQAQCEALVCSALPTVLLTPSTDDATAAAAAALFEKWLSVADELKLYAVLTVCIDAMMEPLLKVGQAHDPWALPGVAVKRHEWLPQLKAMAANPALKHDRPVAALMLYSAALLGEQMLEVQQTNDQLKAKLQLHNVCPVAHMLRSKQVVLQCRRCKGSHGKICDAQAHQDSRCAL